MPLTGDVKREYQRNWMARRRAAFFAGKSCVGCGSTDDLQLDHIDPTQKVDHRVWSWSAVRRKAEIAKCQILCKPCHMSKTIEQTYEGRHLRHGDYHMYSKKGCRCAPCKASVAPWWREYRARKR